jgi:hypothetical protein
VHIRINIYPIYDQKYNIMQKKVYEKVDVSKPDKKEEAVDACGYTGIFNRRNENLRVLTEEEWIRVLNNENKIKDIFIHIREIDRQKNGFVTELELDDIIKLVYPGLKNYDLAGIIGPFSCRENKILVDYKKFRAHVTE